MDKEYDYAKDRQVEEMRMGEFEAKARKETRPRYSHHRLNTSDDFLQEIIRENVEASQAQINYRE